MTKSQWPKEKHSIAVENAMLCLPARNIQHETEVDPWICRGISAGDIDPVARSYAFVFAHQLDPDEVCELDHD